MKKNIILMGVVTLTAPILSRPVDLVFLVLTESTNVTLPKYCTYKFFFFEKSFYIYGMYKLTDDLCNLSILPSILQFLDNWYAVHC